MKQHRSLLASLLLFFVSAALLRAESVVATPDVDALSPAGGEVELTVIVDYGSPPTAMGLQVNLPKGWSFGGLTAGPTPPQIVPPAGTTDKVELAWTSAPAGGAEFKLKLAYPAGAGGTSLTGHAELRRDGKKLELKLHVPLG
ncbi:hypothetical protein [Actomonas aquatica]|uniref:Alpha-galactosidase NEW3 domain-containing protein n=1 Tax=Actomonas aquatica TaxID=2866162 RepID=A0ABZ1C778_9BACT|nr:hypothetical protein [Opitutus sp. WL0086]WRQ86175.1 hypothetical protein K1X11_015275 [Opitutus sp. WL0086]